MAIGAVDVYVKVQLAVRPDRSGKVTVWATASYVTSEFTEQAKAAV
jgi:hypothetical protein